MTHLFQAIPRIFQAHQDSKKAPIIMHTVHKTTAGLASNRWRFVCCESRSVRSFTDRVIASLSIQGGTSYSDPIYIASTYCWKCAVPFFPGGGGGQPV